MRRSQKFLTLISITSVVLSLSLVAAAQSPAQSEKPSTEKVVLKVTEGGCDNTGFCCSGDQAKVAKALEGVPGVTKCVMDRDKKAAIVEYEKGKVKLEDLQKATEKAGFKVEKAKT